MLSEEDSFGLVAFDNVPEAFHPTLQRATREVRDRARGPGDRCASQSKRRDEKCGERQKRRQLHKLELRGDVRPADGLQRC